MGLCPACFSVPTWRAAAEEALDAQRDQVVGVQALEVHSRVRHPGLHDMQHRHGHVYYRY